MADDDVQFSNNLGTISFKRFLVSVEDQYDWDGSRVAHQKQISLQGFIDITDSSELLDAILTPTATMTGQRGTLTMPWALINNVKLASIEYPEDIDINMVPVTATFIDEQPAGQDYTIDWFGYTLHNPRIGVSIPTRECRDDYPHMPVNWGTLFNPFSVGGGVMRTKTAQGLMEISISGTLLIDSYQIPSDLIPKLVQRANMDVSQTVVTTVPSGYPIPFNMQDACPAIANKLPLVNIIVAGGRLVWDVENGMASVSLALLCQPQQVVL